MKFCPRCGQRLTGFELEEKQRYVHQHEAPIKERSWFERHLNWTMVLVWAGAWILTYLVWFFVALTSPGLSEGVFVVIGLVAFYAVSIPVGSWVLRKKNRSQAWLLLCGGFLFLFISNKSPIADYDKAIKLDPSNANAYYERGDAHAEIGEYGRAIADYSKAIELDPRHALAYFNRAYAYGEIGEYNKSIADYSKAIELNPSDAQAYYNRGLDYHNKGEVPKAVSDLEKCIGLSTDPELTDDAQQTLYDIKNSPRRRME